MSDPAGAHDVPEEKEKVSLTLDRSLVEALRASVRPNQLSATVNQMLQRGLQHARLQQLLEELQGERGQASERSYQRLLDDWFDDAD